MANEPRDPKERLKELRAKVFMAYTLVAMQLEQLPLPIELPEVDEDWKAEIGLKAVDRARTVLLAEQPISETLRAEHQILLMDWQTAYELTALAHMGGPMRWRLDGIQTALDRISDATERIIELVNEENPPEEE